MRLVVTLDPSAIEFTTKGSGGPFPYLLDHSDILEQARAGYISGLATGEPPSVTVTLSWRAARILGQALRSRAELFDDDDTSLFVGLIADVAYGLTIVLTVDA